jgi:hypothetical protein
MRAIGTLILSLLICCLFAFSPAGVHNSAGSGGNTHVPGTQ